LKDIPIHFEQPMWLLIPVLLVSVAISAFLYYRNPKQEFFGGLKFLLFFLRFLVIFILGILLLAPFIIHKKKTLERPIVVLAVDMSESMLNNHDSATYSNTLNKMAQNIHNGLNQQFDVDILGFSNKVYENRGENFNGKRTDIGALLQYVEDKYYMLNLSSLILMSDGQNNQGANPEYIAANQSFEINSLLIGDTLSKVDYSIKKLFYNKIVRQGSRFQLDVLIQAEGEAGQKLSVQIEQNKAVLTEKILQIPTNSYSHEVSFELDAKKKGLQSYRVRITGNSTDANSTNNTRRFYVQVVESGNKVLILGSAPHPDLGAIASALRSSNAYEVDVKSLNDYPFDLEKYQLLVLHGIPAHDERSERLLSNPQLKNKALWYILNTSTDFSYLAQQDIPWAISQPKGAYEYAEARYYSNFSNFQMPADWNQQISHFPPLYVPFSNFQSLRKSDVMLWQSIRGFETDKPLLFFWSKARQKYALLAGEGLWKWRYFNYKNEKNHEAFNSFVTRVSRYLLTGVFRERFQIEHKNIYNETDLIQWEAQVYNKAYEPVSEAEIQLEVKDQNGNVYPYQFTNQNGAYHLHFDYLKAGEYQFYAEAVLADSSFVKDGNFVVNAWNMEKANRGANEELMRQISGKSGGKVYYPSQLELLINDLKNRPDFKPRSGFVQELVGMIDLRWIAVLLVILLSVEWFLRKRNGIY